MWKIKILFVKFLEKGNHRPAEVYLYQFIARFFAQPRSGSQVILGSKFWTIFSFLLTPFHLLFVAVWMRRIMAMLKILIFIKVAIDQYESFLRFCKVS